MGVRVVRQGYVYTIERLGKYTLAAEPGLHVIIPFVDRVGAQGQHDGTGARHSGAGNHHQGQRDGRRRRVVFFQVLDAGKAAYEVSNLYVAIMQLTTTNLRTVMGSMDLDETCPSATRSTPSCSVVDHATAPWGVKITRVEIKDIRPPADISNAMARQMKAEREKRARSSRPRACARRKSCAPKVKSRARSSKAEGRREAAFRDAEAREREAEAEAKATQMVSDAIAASGTQALNYFIAQKYVPRRSASSPPRPMPRPSCSRSRRRS
jgi:regulator of protease activity HflC (stomatin/prohibitin superfamily)